MRSPTLNEASQAALNTASIVFTALIVTITAAILASTWTQLPIEAAIGPALAIPSNCLFILWPTKMRDAAALQDGCALALANITAFTVITGCIYTIVAFTANLPHSNPFYYSLLLTIGIPGSATLSIYFMKPDR